MDPAAQADALNNMIGPTQGINGPVSWLLALYDGDPTGTGVEAAASDCPGYARVTVAKADWDEATEADPIKQTTDPVQFPDVPADPDPEVEVAWGRTMTYWGLLDPVDPTILRFSGQIARDQQLDITAAGTGPAVTPAIFFDEGTEES